MATDRERGKQAQSQAFAREVKAAVADYFERNRLSRMPMRRWS